jgi:hypothetical protein
MKKIWLYAAIFLPLLLAFTPLIYSADASTFQAEEPAAVTAPGPNAIPIKVGVYILNVGNLDMTTGTYSIDFYLNLRCERACEPAIDLMNATTAPEIEDQTGDHRGNTWYTYRIRANLVTDLNLRRFPFDDHQLAIEIEDKRLSTSDAFFVVDESMTGIDTNAHVSGWLLKPVWEAAVTEHVYPVFSGETYSRYRFFVTIYHPWFTSFMKTLFAAVVIVLVGMLSFFMQPSAAGERLALTSSTLVGSILYHLTITSTIPPVSYLTYADKFMIANYIVVSAAMAVSVALMWFRDTENANKANRLHQWTRIPIPVIWVISMIVITLMEFR